MIIVAKYIRKTRLRKGVSSSIGRQSHLFDPVYGMRRDHIRINKFTGSQRQQKKKSQGLTKGGWYVIRGSRERYIDSGGREKSSIIVDNYFRLF